MGNSSSSSNLAGNDAGASAQRARLNSEPGIGPYPTLRPNPTRNSMYGGVPTPNEGSARFVASASSGGVVHNVKPTTYPPLFGEATVPPRAAPRSTKEASGGVAYYNPQRAAPTAANTATVPPHSTKDTLGGVAYNPQRAAPASVTKATVPLHSTKETLGGVAYNAQSQPTAPPSSKKTTVTTVPPTATVRPTKQTPEGVTCYGVSQTKAPAAAPAPSKATVPTSSIIRPTKEASGATAALASVPTVPVTRTAVSSASSVTKPSVTQTPSTAQPAAVNLRFSVPISEHITTTTPAIPVSDAKSTGSAQPAAVNPRFSVPISEHISTPAVPVPDAKSTDGSKTASVNPRFHVPVSTTEHTSMSIAPDKTTAVKKSAPPSPQPQSNLCVNDSNRPATVSPFPSRSSSPGPGAAVSGVNGQTQASAPVDPLPSIIAAAAPPRTKKPSPPVATPTPLPLVAEPCKSSAASNEKQEHVSSQDECSLPSPSGQAPVDPHPEVSANENKQAVTESSVESEPKTPPVEVLEGDVAKEKPKIRSLPVMKLKAGIPIELPMFRDTVDVPCEEEACKLTLENALDLAQSIVTEGLGELILKAACDDMDPKSFVNRSCRYCNSTIVNFHAIFGHVLGLKHLRKLYNSGRYITKDDLEFWSSKVERARKLLPPKFQVSDRNFFYKDRDGRIQGPVPELQMQEWYRRGYFTSTTQIGVEQDYYFVSLYDLLKENGHSTPFAAAGAGVFDRTKVNAASISRPEYLLPLVHPIALPPVMFLSDDLLLNEMERLRSKFCKLTPSAFDAALMPLIPLPVYCTFCSTAALKSRSAFFAHLVNRQHLERLAENNSGVTQADIDYWANILELVEPTDGETNEEHYFLLNGGRLRAENGTILYRKGCTSKSKAPNMPARSLSSSTASLQSTSSSVPQNSSAASKSRPSATNPSKSSTAKPNTSSAKESFFFTPLLSNQKLAESQYLSQADALKVAAFAFSIISRKFNVGVTAEAINKLAADHLGNAPFRLCPICPKERLNPSIAFFSHILRDRHIAKLYDANIRAAYSDFAFWMKALGLYLPPMAHILQEVQNQIVKKKEQGPPTKNIGPAPLNGDKVKKMENPPVKSPLSNLPLMKKNPKKTGLPRAEGVKLISELRAKIQKKYKTDSNKDLYNATKHLFGEVSTAICPICPTIRTQCGKPFVDHLFATKHIENLYESGASICVEDVDHWSNVFLNK